jgi:hypothetical protein
MNYSTNHHSGKLLYLINLPLLLIIFNLKSTHFIYFYVYQIFHSFIENIMISKWKSNVSYLSFLKTICKKDYNDSYQLWSNNLYTKV